MRYADMVYDRQRDRLLAVREDHTGEGEAVNTLVAIPLDRHSSGQVLVSGNDFYAYPRVSPDGPLPADAGGGAPLSPLIHGRARLLILSHLIGVGPTPFTELRALLGMTDGALSVHLSKLEEGGLVEIIKEFVGKRPRTRVKVTRRGRRLFARYVDELRAIVPGLD